MRGRERLLEATHALRIFLRAELSHGQSGHDPLISATCLYF